MCFIFEILMQKIPHRFLNIKVQFLASLFEYCAKYSLTIGHWMD